MDSPLEHKRCETVFMSYLQFFLLTERTEAASALVQTETPSPAPQPDYESAAEATPPPLPPLPPPTPRFPYPSISLGSNLPQGPPFASSSDVAPARDSWQAWLDLDAPKLDPVYPTSGVTVGQETLLTFVVPSFVREPQVRRR